MASIAVDFPKSGIPAVLSTELTLKKTIPRAHWRELKGLPSFHCTSAVGKLYDEVINEMNSKRNMPQLNCTAMAGRYRDNNGQILFLGDRNKICETKKMIFSPTFARYLGWRGDSLDERMLVFAKYQQFLYDNQVLELMNQYKIKSEGEVTTGCILKFHKLHKRRRHDIAEKVRRQFRGIKKLFRSEFFTAVYHLIHGNADFLTDEDDIAEDDVSEKDLEWIEAASTGIAYDDATVLSDGESGMKAKQIACRLAAAYYVAAYSPSTHDDRSKSVLYSFPWVIAADVISYNICES